MQSVITTTPFNFSQHRIPATIPCDPCKLNGYDACLVEELAMLRSLREACVDGFGYQSRKDPNQNELLGKQIRLNEIGILPLPGAPGSGIVVLSYRVPPGYKGQITQVINGFLPGAGATYLQGSNQLVFHLLKNIYYVFSYGSIVTDLGSLTTGYNLTGKGIEIQENQTIQYLVDISSVTFGPGNIVAGIQGYIQPIV